MAVDAVPFAAVGDNCIDRYVPPLRPDSVGGNALNVAVGFVQAGHPARYLGAVGDDDDGRLVLEAARAAGVDLDGVHVLAEPTGVTTVELLPGGERRFVHEAYGASASYRLDAEGLRLLAGSRWVHASNLGGATEAVDELASAGHALSYDFSDRDDERLRSDLCPALQVAFFSVPGDDRAAAVELAGAARAEGAAVAVVTRGAQGSLAVHRGGTVDQEALAAHVVDTLGAGDAFIAAFVAAFAVGGSIQTALRRGAQAAARTCEIVGPWPAAKEVRA